MVWFVSDDWNSVSNSEHGNVKLFLLRSWLTFLLARPVFIVEVEFFSAIKWNYLQTFLQSTKKIIIVVRINSLTFILSFNSKEFWGKWCIEVCFLQKDWLYWLKKILQESTSGLCCKTKSQTGDKPFCQLVIFATKNLLP